MFAPMHILFMYKVKKFINYLLKFYIKKTAYYHKTQISNMKCTQADSDALNGLFLRQKSMKTVSMTPKTYGNSDLNIKPIISDCMTPTHLFC